MKKRVTQHELEQLATRLATVIRGGEVIELVGDVGAGKTTFTKALAAAMGVTGIVQSPSFTISNRYDAAHDITLAHYDFYRLHDAGIMRDELADTMEDSSVVTVLEWSDIVAHVLPKDRLAIRFTPVSEEERMIEIVSGGVASERLMGVLA